MEQLFSTVETKIYPSLGSIHLLNITTYDRDSQYSPLFGRFGDKIKGDRI